MADQFTLEVYWANWAGPSSWLKDQIEQQSAMLEKLGCNIVFVDVDSVPGQVWQTRVFTVPTVVLFKSGEEYWRKSGLLTINLIADKIKLHKALER